MSTKRGARTRPAPDAALVARVHRKLRRELGEPTYLRYLAAMAAREPALRRKWKSAAVGTVLSAIDALDIP